MWNSNGRTGTMAADEVTPVTEQVTPTEPAATDPRVEFAHQIVTEAARYGYRHEAIRIVQVLLPGFQPEHVALAHAKAYADHNAPGLPGSAEYQAVVTAYLAGVDNR